MWRAAVAARLVCVYNGYGFRVNAYTLHVQATNSPPFSGREESHINYSRRLLPRLEPAAGGNDSFLVTVDWRFSVQPREPSGLPAV